MRVKAIVLTATACAISMATTSAQAAPTMESTKLPFSNANIEELKQSQHFTDDQVKDFLKTLWRLDVYEDHENPRKLEQRNDKNIKKVFYGAPFLTPSKTRSVVGAQEFATDALEVLDSLDNVARTFNFRLRELERLGLERTDKENRVKFIEQKLTTQLDAATRTSMENLRAGLLQDIQNIKAREQAILSEGSAGANQLGEALRKEIVNDVIFQMSRLGISPTQEEEAMLRSTDTTQMSLGMAKLRARGGNGQLGLRQVVMESGLDDEQMKAMVIYRQIRPDVELKSLNVKTMNARAAAQTFLSLQNEREDRKAPVMLRGINGGTTVGPCGASRSCNVVLEYTSIGARAARMAKTGAVVIPVTFEADVDVLVPPFKGGVKCDFKTGWTAQGRADVRDGAIIYDGDVTNKIKFNSTDEGGCKLTIEQGSQESGEYTALKMLYDQLLTLHYERRQRSKADKDAYEQYVRGELARHAQQSQANRGGSWFSDVIGIFTGGFGGVVGWLVGEAREFYWHTRIEDTASFDEIHIDEQVSISNVTRTERRNFDGFPLVCFKKTSATSLDSTMAACPDALADERTTESETGNRNCNEDQSLNDCRQTVDNTPPNSQGYVENPF